MTPEKDDALQAYLQRILALKGQRDADLTPDELQAIALEVGLTEADLEAGRRAGENHLARGAGYMQHERWDDAVGELEAALALLPNRVDVLMALAEAHRGRHAARGGDADREAAVRLARRCLAIDPRHGPAFKLLNALDRQAPRQGAWIAAAAIAGLLVAGGFLASNRLSAPPPRPQPADAGKKAAPLPKAQELPVSLGSEKSEGLALETRISRVNRYTGATYYKIAGLLGNAGDQEFTQLHVQLDLLDAAGRVVTTNSFKPLDTYHAPLRPGDRHAFTHTLKTSPEITRVELTMLTRSGTPAARRYPEARSLPAVWASGEPLGGQLAIRERAATVRRAVHRDNTIFFNPLWEIENAGEASVRGLKLQLLLRDRQGELVEADERLVLSGEGMEIHPGETRVVSWPKMIPARYDHYVLRVLELE